MDVVLAASAVVTRENGDLLLVQRGRAPERGRWSVPGGRVEPGESLAEAAARETLEETGLHVRVGAELWSLRLSGDNGVTYQIHDFAATVVGGTLRPGDDAADVRWVPAADVPALPLVDTLLHYLQGAGLVPVRESSA